MGINGLNTFLKEKIPEINNTVSLDKFKNEKCAIDTSIFFYKFKYSNHNFIEGFLKQIYRLKLNNIIPIYILDGKPPIEKYNILKLRRKKKYVIIKNIKKLEDQIKDCKNLLEKIKLNCKIEALKKKIIIITDSDIKNFKLLLEYLGIPYIQSKTEADFLCNTLYKNKIISIVISEDTDMLVGGTKRLIKNFNIYSNRVILFDLDIILKQLELNKEQWIHFCILLGCDYCLKIHNFNTNDCLELIKTHNINNIFIKKLNLNKEYICDFTKAKNLFIKNEKIDENLNEIFNKKPNMSLLIKFLEKNTTLSKKELSYILKVFM